MSHTPPAVDDENYDAVIAVEASEDAAHKPFVRKKPNIRSTISGHIEKRNRTRLEPVHHTSVSSVDSDDPSHVPGPTPLDSPRARRKHKVIQGVTRQLRSQPQNKLDHDVQSVSSSSDIERPNSSSVPRPQQRRLRNTSSLATCIENEGEVRHQPLDDPVDWGGRTVPQRKRQAEQALQSIATKRKSPRRVPSTQKDEGIRQVKEDRQRREASQWHKSNSELHPSSYRERERNPVGTISIEDGEYNEDDFINRAENMKEAKGTEDAQLSLGCNDDLTYVPMLNKDETVARRGNATTRPPRDVSKAEEILSLDHEEVTEEVKDLNIDAPYTGPTHLIFEYPRGQKGKIRVTAEERGRLEAKKYLNDSLIDFFFKYQEVALQQRAAALRVTAKFFSSFFFGRLRRTKPIDYEGVKGWTKDVDIFSKQFVFVPICDSYHWSLIIIANLHNLNEFLGKSEEEYVEHERPRIVYLDSLDPSRGTSFGDSIRRYLVEEWLCRKKQLTAHEAEKKNLLNRFRTAIPLLKAKVPLQTNEYDCGLYVLNSLEMFLNNDGYFMDDLLCGEDQVSDAYTHVDIQLLRERLVLLMDHFELEWRENTRCSSDGVNNPTENGSAPDLHAFKDHVSNDLTPETPTRSNEEGRELKEEQYSHDDERISRSFPPNENEGIHAQNDKLSEENKLKANETVKVRDVNGVWFSGEPVVSKVIMSADCASENPTIELRMENGTQDHEELRPSPIYHQVMLGSASFSDMPKSPLKDSDLYERETYANSDCVEQMANSVGEDRKHSGIIGTKADEKLKIISMTRNNEDETHQMEPELMISLDAEEFVFQTTVPQHLPRSKVESERADDEVPETVDPGMNSLSYPESHLEVGYGGNTYHLRDSITGDRDLTEIPDESIELAQAGIDIYKNTNPTNDQLNDSQTRSNLCQNRSLSEAIAQELQTVDHTGEMKTYKRRKD
eukprot:TRINITY_DN2178_c0_g1_i1.p1 TRINITY_DN2178_c0_g1~~TRINITY_DN2178_c0_g1_i1.p1  ORF type:complete len:954 (-),score=139.68 TRINITY_DN2178_c0_g1_i1:3720-6581(-)